jgi:hypothetical protein
MASAEPRVDSVLASELGDTMRSPIAEGRVEVRPKAMAVRARARYAAATTPCRLTDCQHLVAYIQGTDEASVAPSADDGGSSESYGRRMVRAYCSSLNVSNGSNVTGISIDALPRQMPKRDVWWCLNRERRCYCVMLGCR